LIIDPPPSVVELVKDNKEADNIWKQWISNLRDILVDKRRTVLTASGAVKIGTESLELSHASVVIAATIDNTLNHPGFFIVKNTSSGGTAAHTCTLTTGTWNGTNNVATLNAPGEALCVYFDSAGDGVIIENIGAVALS